MLRLLILTVASLLAAPAAAELPEPGHGYRVVGVDAGDVLNVRAHPGTAGEIVGSLPPDATGLVVTGVRQEVAGATWWQLFHEAVQTGIGWINARFLAPMDVHAGPETDFPLLCAGTEPFWVLRIGGWQAGFEMLGGPTATWTASRWMNASGRPPGWRFAIRLDDEAASSLGWVGISRPQQYCSDGMSDLEYPYDALMVTPTGEALAGCCRRMR